MTYMADNGDNKIHIIGIGDDGIEGLSSGARTLLSEAELVVGTPPTLALAATPDAEQVVLCLLYTSPSPRDRYGSRMPSSA